MAEGQGNITYGSTKGSGGGSGSITSVEEISGVKVTTAGTVVSLTNRLNFFFVQQFGAIGDGVTDDTAAIQACFTAAGAAMPAGGAVVFFAHGQYKISASINWPNTTIWCFGSGATYPFGPAISQIIMDSTTDSAFIIPGNGCKVTDIYFQQAGGATAGAAVMCNGFRLTVRDCAFQGFWNGVEQTVQVTSLIDHCQFIDQVNHCIDTSNSANPDDGDGLISGCTFSSTAIATAAGFFQNGSGGQKISGCKFVSSGILMINCVECVFGPETSTSDLLISNCSFEQYTGIGILIDVPAGGEFYNVTITGCNVSSYNTGNGIVLIGTGGQLFNICISGCSITNNLDGILITDVNKVSVSGTLFNGNSNNIAQTGVNDNIFYDRWFHTVSNPASGDTVQLEKWTFAGIEPGAPIAALTLALPASPIEGNETEYTLERLVTALSFTGGSVAGSGVNQVGFRKLKYDTATAIWY